MKECSKSIPRRIRDSRFISRYFVGDGIDIGGKPDPLGLYLELFPLMTSVRTWDLEDGDAQYMSSVEDETLDFVHSSHCLEHVIDPFVALNNWLRILKPGGYCIVTVPDEDLYEQGVFPSTYNMDHKHTFTIHKLQSWSTQSVNMIDLLTKCGDRVRIEKIELINESYRYTLPRYDQTLTPICESAIEFVIRKSTTDTGMMYERDAQKGQPANSLRVHYNQYSADRQAYRINNILTPPFKNEEPL